MVRIGLLGRDPAGRSPPGPELLDVHPTRPLGPLGVVVWFHEVDQYGHLGVAQRAVVETRCDPRQLLERVGDLDQLAGL